MKNLPETDIDTWTGKVLYRFGVGRIEVDLSGGGDSGDIDEVRYYADREGTQPLDTDEIESRLRRLRVPQGTSMMPALDILRRQWDTDASDQGNWYDNEGGSVNSAYTYDETGTECEHCDITYNEYDDEYDDEDEELDEEEEQSLEKNTTLQPVSPDVASLKDQEVSDEAIEEPLTWDSTF